MSKKEPKLDIDAVMAVTAAANDIGIRTGPDDTDVFGVSLMDGTVTIDAKRFLEICSVVVAARDMEIAFRAQEKDVARSLAILRTENGNLGDALNKVFFASLK